MDLFAACKGLADVNGNELQISEVTEMNSELKERYEMKDMQGHASWHKSFHVSVTV